MRGHLRALCVVFALSVLAGCGGAGVLLVWGNARIDRQLVAGLAGGEPGAGATRRVVNVLVVGSDTRDGLSEQERKRLGVFEADGSRTDTMMLAQLEVNGDGRAAVLSLPRDLLVTRCDGTQGKLNAAYHVGEVRDGDGPSCLVDTVSDATGIDIHHYLEVSFAGFVEAVDAIGGVGLYLQEPFSDAQAHLELPAGCVTLDGRNALAFVRARQVDSDYGRMARQQRFVKEMVRDVAELGTLADPAGVVGLVDSLAGAVRTDEGLGATELRDLALGLRGLRSDEVRVHSVPSQTIDLAGVSYEQVERASAERLFAAFRDQQVLSQPVADARDVEPVVTIRNATDIDGLAASTQALLRSQGWEVAEVSNAEAPQVATRVYAPPELAAAGDRLAAQLLDAEVVVNGPGEPLIVELGSDLDLDTVAALTPAGGATEPVPEPVPSERQSARASRGTAPAAYTGAELTDVDC